MSDVQALGDFATGQTVTCRFPTSDDIDAPITIVGAVARVRKGSGSGSLITAGVTFTTDVMTGQHCVDVDLSASGSYAAGFDYYIELSAGVVNSVSMVGKVLGHFSIANRVATAPLSAAGVRAAVGLASANLDTQLDALPTNAELATALASSDDATLAAIAAIWTTALTESYNADGAAPTPAQALFVIMQRLLDFSISGTTLTAKKLDGSTTAFTLTFDDADSPTSSARAT